MTSYSGYTDIIGPPPQLPTFLSLPNSPLLASRFPDALQTIWSDAKSERGSLFLLQQCLPTPKSPLTDEFLSRWLNDEQRHFRFFAAILAVVTHSSPTIIQEHIDGDLLGSDGKRNPAPTEAAELSRLLGNERTLLSALLVDEVISRFTYPNELEMYRFSRV